MVVLNYSGEEINAKIVYYGPGLSGKTTNLEYIHEKMPVRSKGKLVSMKTRTDRTLFFDFLPLELGEINGYRSRFLLYTVPGQVYYNATRKLVLKGVDAVVFVADSSRAKLAENIESLRNLEDNLNEHELSLDHVPWVIQYNKRDIPDAMPVTELHENLNLLGVPAFEAVATKGRGVYETFQGVAGLLFESLRRKLERGEVETAAAADMQPQGDVDGVADAVDTALREVAPGKIATTQAERPPAPQPRPDAAAPARETQKEHRAQSAGSPADASHVGQPPASAPEIDHAVPAPVGAHVGPPDAEPASAQPATKHARRVESLPDAPEAPEAHSDANSTVRIEEAAAASEAVRSEAPPEFIIDPLGHGAGATAESAGVDASSVREPEVEDVDLDEASVQSEEPLVIPVPVSIPRSRLAGARSVRIQLDIDLVD